MRLAVLLAAIPLLAGCHPRDTSMLPQPEAYAHFQDRLAARMYSWGIGWRRPCSGSDTERENAIAWEEQCFRFSKPERMTGLWRNEFEGPTFCPSPAKKCPDATFTGPHQPIYGNMDIATPPSGWDDTVPGGLYAVEFIGRRSEYGLSGGTTGADKHVIVERWISVKQIEAPPPQPTKEQLAAWWKQCQANQTCFGPGPNGAE